MSTQAVFEKECSQQRLIVIENTYTSEMTQNRSSRFCRNRLQTSTNTVEYLPHSWRCDRKFGIILRKRGRVCFQDRTMFTGRPFTSERMLVLKWLRAGWIQLKLCNKQLLYLFLHLFGFARGIMVSLEQSPLQTVSFCL